MHHASIYPVYAVQASALIELLTKANKVTLSALFGIEVTY